MAANFMSSERAVAVVVVLLGCLLCLQHGVDAAPPPFGFKLLQPAAPKALEPVKYTRDNACYPGAKHDPKVEELCQRCAKTTKSDMVYPMCCGDEEATREWCQEYLAYGIFRENEPS